MSTPKEITMANGLHELVNEQVRAWVCGEFGCDQRFVLPLQIRKETQEVLSQCALCHSQSWVQLPPEGFKRFLVDVAAGKIHWSLIRSPDMVCLRETECCDDCKNGRHDLCERRDRREHISSTPGSYGGIITRCLCPHQYHLTAMQKRLKVQLDEVLAFNRKNNPPTKKSH